MERQRQQAVTDEQERIKRAVQEKQKEEYRLLQEQEQLRKEREEKEQKKEIYTNKILQAIEALIERAQLPEEGKDHDVAQLLDTYATIENNQKILNELIKKSHEQQLDKEIRDKIMQKALKHAQLKKQWRVLIQNTQQTLQVSIEQGTATREQINTIKAHIARIDQLLQQ